MCPYCGGRLEWFYDGGEARHYEENWYRCEKCGSEFENEELEFLEQEKHDARSAGNAESQTIIRKCGAEMKTNKNAQKDKFMKNEQKIGATGEFPDGKLNEHDEGELAVAITSDPKSRRIIMEFGKEIACIAMTPEEADGFGDLLKRRATELTVKIPDAEKERIVEKVLPQMFEKSAAPVKFELNLPYAVGLISQLQLAFRHPQNVGPTREHLEKLVRDLIERLDPERGDFYQFLMMGFDEAYDE